MAKPVPAKWVYDGIARKMIADVLGYGPPMAAEAYGLLLAALRDGDVQARLTLHNADNSLSERSHLLDPSYWNADADGKALRTPWAMDINGLVEIDLISVSKWLHPVADKDRRRPGRATEIDWEDMWIELVTRANTLDGIDPNIRISTLAIDMETWFSSSGRRVPDKSAIEKKLRKLPLFKRTK